MPPNYTTNGSTALVGDGDNWKDIDCREEHGFNITHNPVKVFGKCIVIRGNFIVLLLHRGIFSFETPEPEYFTLFNDYEIHPDSYKLIQHF